jgi:hypothetical protein
MKGILIALTVAIMLSSCGKSKLLEKEHIAALTFTQEKRTAVIYFDKLFSVSEGGGLTIRTHSIVRVGDNMRSVPEYFYVYDRSVEKLVTFEGRVRHRTGSVETYGKGDLHALNLSNRRSIRESYLKYLPIDEDTRTGDMIETMTVHEMTLPPLGIDFSVSEAGDIAENITCSIEIPARENLHYKVLNDSLQADVTEANNRKTYRFTWKGYTKPEKRWSYKQRNDGPTVLAALPRIDDSMTGGSWSKFGDWYLNLVMKKLEPTSELATIAREITAGKTTDREKLDAIFEYCQRNIRYEQVYLAKGEFIPNDARLILSRKYGDCKDYSTIIYSMATSVGVTPNLALCYRGRGVKFEEDIPASQFNHMIVHFRENGEDYWYDGTNRSGIPGLTTGDMINGHALVLDHGNSRIVRIPESKNNRVLVTGTLTPRNNDLGGNLTVTLASQYAMDFFYDAMFLNAKKMEQNLVDWLKSHLNSAMLAKKISWTTQRDRFVIDVVCELPNALTVIDKNIYVSFSKAFPEVLPEENPLSRPDELFYYPYYNRMSLNLELAGLRDHSSTHTSGSYRWMMDVDLPPGPFDTTQKAQFLEEFSRTTGEFTAKTKLVRKE